MPRVIVSHPQRQYSHQLVYALQEGNMLLRHFTGFWYKPDKFPYNILKKIPGLEKQFKRRYFEKINPDLVSQNPLFEIKHRIISRKKADFWLKVNREFDK